MKFSTFSMAMSAILYVSVATAAKIEPVKSIVTPKLAGEKDTNSGTIPKLNSDEYAIFIDQSYKIFKTKTFEKLELSENCFKKTKPDCIAFSVSQSKPGPVKITTEGATNLAAINCANLGGKNLIGMNSKRDQFNFCRFEDGSMITSWSMYFKYNPTPVIK